MTYEKIFADILKSLPYRLSDEIRRITREKGVMPEEIRLREGRRASLTHENANIILSSVLDKDEIQNTLRNLTNDSLYAYNDSIKNGFIPLENGIRVGISGTAVTENDAVLAIYSINSIVIRLPKELRECAGGLLNIIKRSNGHVCSVLIYAPSGVGKTTVLRSLAYYLSKPPVSLRVALIDSRDELGAFLSGSGLLLDILSGYPKDKGVEIAARTMNSEVIISDEIFSLSEAHALGNAVGCGIPIICSAHAENIDNLLKRPAIRYLHEMRVFDLYIGIKRDCEKDFIYTVNEREEYADI